MDGSLLRAFARAREAALGEGGREGGEAVLEALALLLVLDLTGALGKARGLGELLEAGRRALLSAGAGDEDLARARALAREGLAAATGSPRSVEALGDRLHPPDGRLLDMLRGEPDGFSAASCAEHVRRCERCSRALRVLELSRGAAAAPMRAAAATAEPVRSPADGRVLLRLDEPALEVVLLALPAPARLAIYASEPVAVRLEASSARTENMLGGYWIGVLGPELRKVEGTLHVGDVALPFEVELPER